jgi:hypothetical protein
MGNLEFQSTSNSNNYQFEMSVSQEVQERHIALYPKEHSTA